VFWPSTIFIFDISNAFNFKHTMKKSLFSLAVLFLAVALFQSCKKDDSTSANNTDQTTAQDITASNDLTEIADAEVEDALADNFTAGSADDRGGCAQITYAQPQGTWPNTITIDYGTGCNQPSGIIVKGKIIVVQSNAITVSGAVRQVTYDNFFVENVQISGNRTLTNAGLNAAGQPYFTKTGSETLTFPDGDVATRNINHVRTMVEGYNTPQVRADNVWQVTGTDTGVNRNGNDYTVTITSPLVRKFTCPWIVSGVITLVVDTKTRTLDFGDGTCERDATLTRADGEVREIKIRRRWWR
jgi:hypothetical protein